MSDVQREPGSDPIGDDGPIPPREQLVKTAAKFLSSRNVVNSAHENKVAFLKKKGLSDAEIDLALKQAEVVIQSRNFECNTFPVQSAMLPYPPAWHQQPSWMKYRDIANSVALIGGLAYAVYWFYKKYLVPFLFGGGKKNLDSRLSDLDKMITSSLLDLKNSVSRVRDDMERLTERRVESLSRQIDELKTEVSSLKKLMLSSVYLGTCLCSDKSSIADIELDHYSAPLCRNEFYPEVKNVSHLKTTHVELDTEKQVPSRPQKCDVINNLTSETQFRKQFPSATVSGPLTIPSWQLASAAEEKEVEEEGAGSGTNGSDSSLEMIKE